MCGRLPLWCYLGGGRLGPQLTLLLQGTGAGDWVVLKITYLLGEKLKTNAYSEVWERRDLNQAADGTVHSKLMMPLWGPLPIFVRSS